MLECMEKILLFDRSAKAFEKKTGQIHRKM